MSGLGDLAAIARSIVDANLYMVPVHGRAHDHRAAVTM
jgi:hypothetical protein